MTDPTSNMVRRGDPSLAKRRRESAARRERVRELYAQIAEPWMTTPEVAAQIARMICVHRDTVRRDMRKLGLKQK